MRNDRVIQFPGSKVTHHPHPFNVGTLCGRDGRSVWRGDYYEILPEVTCKTCQRTIPAGKWTHVTSPYHHYRDVLTSSFNAETYREIRAEWAGGFTWLPSADGQLSGLLINWYEPLQTWAVFTYDEVTAR